MAFYRIALAAVGAAIGASSVANAQSTDWTSRININGDFRYRFQRDLNYGYTATNGATGTSDNNFSRIRARLGINAKVNDSLMANFRLSTSPATNSQNQVLGRTEPGGAGASDAAPFSMKKFFGLDLAYFDYKIVDGVNFQGGKMPNLFWTPGKNEMLWNSNLSFEGIQGKWWMEAGSFKPYATVSYSYVADRINSAPTVGTVAEGPDVMLLAAQVGINWKSDPMWATLAIGSYNYNNVKDLQTNLNPIVAASGTSSATGGYLGNYVGNNGNSTVGTGTGQTFATDYKELDAGLEIGYNLGFAPISVYGEYVNNSNSDFASAYTGPTDQKTAMIGGIRLGNLTSPGTWFVGYNYRNVQKDALFGLYGEAGFLGSGGTNTLGSQVQLGYQAWQNAALGFTYETGLRNISPVAATGVNGSAINFESYYADIVMNF